MVLYGLNKKGSNLSTVDKPQRWHNLKHKLAKRIQSMQSKVAIIMGSDSDWPALKGCYDTLKTFDIDVTVKISSAHRSPDETATFASDAKKNGFGVMICAAGMAAHLAGVVAAHTTLPVIGIPMASGALQGMDSLLSTVQMPPGIPVATVGIGAPGAKNAALLAVQMLALANSDLAKKLDDHKVSLAQGVSKKNAQLQKELQ